MNVPDGMTVYRNEADGLVIHVHYSAGDERPYVWGVQPADQTLAGEYEWPSGAESLFDMAVGQAYMARASVRVN